jgi:hypothetical protein
MIRVYRRKGKESILSVKINGFIALLNTEKDCHNWQPT